MTPPLAAINNRHAWMMCPRTHVSPQSPERLRRGEVVVELETYEIPHRVLRSTRNKKG